ncbi:MAG: hypothetical protein ACLR6B_21670 [Blautia sp.]
MRSGAFWRLFRFRPFRGLRPLREAYGNPAVFSWKYAPLFQTLTGDQGGKKVLDQLLDDCFFYELPERSRRDIDTPEDL